ncbi:MAG: tetratricopeptide repeat protein [Flavobacteriales bacterium]|nr:tetratricopeptide repeat protein [Flavobacteriales bacterium]
MRCALLVLVVLGLPLQAQVDSLRQVLGGLPDDTNRLPVLKELVRNLVFVQPDSALPYAEAYHRLAKRTKDPVRIGEGANFAGMCHQTTNEHEKALGWYLEALHWFEQGDDPWYTAITHNNIGAALEKQDQRAEARPWYRGSLEQFQVIGDSIWVANVSNNLANIYYHDQLLDSAAYFYEEAYRILSAKGHLEYAAAVLMNLANTRLAQGKVDEALPDYHIALKMLPAGSDESTRANVLVNLGECLGRSGRADTAVIAARSGVELAAEVGSKEIIMNGHEILSNLFEQLGLPDSALAHYRLHAAWKDSIFNEERSAQVAELKERYESGKKDAELERNRATLEQNAFEKKALGAGALLLLLAGVFAFRAYRIRKRSSEQLGQKNAVIGQALKEKELLLREIHHRVKNNLQVISSLLSIQSRGITDLKAREAVRDSRDRVKSMALIHQDLYKEDDLTGIDLPTYVNKLARSLVSSHQLAPEQITLSTNVDPLVLDVDTAIPLGLILNELLTNALKYAFPEGRPGRLWITIREANDQLHVEVRDDGVGYDPNAERGEESSGFGLDMVRSFATKLKAEWEVRNDGGTVVDLRIGKYRKAQ